MNRLHVELDFMFSYRIELYLRELVLFQKDNTIRYHIKKRTWQKTTLLYVKKEVSIHKHLLINIYT